MGFMRRVGPIDVQLGMRRKLSRSCMGLLVCRRVVLVTQIG